MEKIVFAVLFVIALAATALFMRGADDNDRD